MGEGGGRQAGQIHQLNEDGQLLKGHTGRGGGVGEN